MIESNRLKNRGYSETDVKERRHIIEQKTKCDLSPIADYSFNSEKASKNIENMIGVTQVPLGFAGPILINGDFAKGRYLVPLATTEGALIASISRGMSVITSAGGSKVKIFNNMMTRAPVFRVDGIDHCVKVIEWINQNRRLLDNVVSETTTHGKLLEIEPFPNGRNLHIRLKFSTGDAMGMNMVTIASESIGKLIEKNTEAKMVSVSGNMCTDKKPAAINSIYGRGKYVVAEARIPEDIVRVKLHSTTSAIIELNERKNLIGSAMAGSLGFNAHAANMAAALYIATGQDPAHVIEASMCITTCENVNENLYIAVRIPSIEVGTVGGGTNLPSQSAALKMIDCFGEGKACKLGEITATTILAGELSTLGAQAAGHLGTAHRILGR
ncbi:MAG: hydroxymethylglutaryl-CoA reductase (NADPH) [archaeon]|nr:hydroxymethylglutaryl-CoA reductase (NADPH) [archaeon]